MSGSSSKGIVIGVLALVVVGAALWYSGVIGGKPAKEDDATAATDAATPATDTPAPAQPESPAGVPAPADTVIANFDGGSAQAPYGMGIQAGGDEFQGGKSTATQQVIDGGANGSKGSLEVSGEVRPGTQYPSAGTYFFPEGPPTQGIMDYSAKTRLSFYAKGDGQQYQMMVLSGTPMKMPPLMLGFTAGPEWQKYEFEIPKLGAADWKRVRMIGWMQMAQGPFKFQLDEIQLE
jgi:hypothetical protein